MTDLLLNGGDAGISYGRYSDKAFIIVTLLTRGETIEIFPTEEIEVDAPGSRIPEEVHWKETLWKARYFLQQNRPMLIDGKLLRKYALQ